MADAAGRPIRTIALCILWPFPLHKTRTEKDFENGNTQTERKLVGKARKLFVNYYNDSIDAFSRPIDVKYRGKLRLFFGG